MCVPPPLQSLSEALISLQVVYPRRNLSADQWRNAQLLSLISAPSTMLNPAQSDTVSTTTVLLCWPPLVCCSHRDVLKSILRVSCHSISSYGKSSLTNPCIVCVSRCLVNTCLWTQWRSGLCVSTAVFEPKADTGLHGGTSLITNVTKNDSIECCKCFFLVLVGAPNDYLFSASEGQSQSQQRSSRSDPLVQLVQFRFNNGKFKTQSSDFSACKMVYWASQHDIKRLKCQEKLRHIKWITLNLASSAQIKRERQIYIWTTCLHPDGASFVFTSCCTIWGLMSDSSSMRRRDCRSRSKLLTERLRRSSCTSFTASQRWTLSCVDFYN